MPRDETITLAHSPDPDDAFMWWPLGTPDRQPAIDTEGFRFEPVHADIEQLNQRAIATGDLDITAISVHAYPHVKETYALTSCGFSMGRAYGPRIVAREAHDTRWLKESHPTIAVPGRKTTAYLALRLLLGGEFDHVVAPFDQVVDVVRAGSADAGLVIHEAQLTYEREQMHLVADLGEWWEAETGLPLPLGANAIRRDLERRFGPGSLARITRVLARSIRHAMEHRELGMEIAGRHAATPDAPAALIERFVGMYVNELTIDPGEAGERAIALLLRRGRDAGLCPDPGEIELLRPAPEGV